jgi:hypothetical protein
MRFALCLLLLTQGQDLDDRVRDLAARLKVDGERDAARDALLELGMKAVPALERIEATDPEVEAVIREITSREARALFETMVRKLDRAKTIHAHLTITAQCEGAEHGRLVGHVVFADPDKVDLTVGGTVSGEKVEIVVRSDGTRCRVSGAPEALEEAPARSLVRAMKETGMAFLLFARRDPLDPKSGYRIDRYRMGKTGKVGDREARSIGLWLKFGKTALVRSFVWIDIETGLPLRHNLKFDLMGLRATITEVYDELTLDEEFDPDRFRPK